MFTFLRKIRKSLIEAGSVRRYIVYAVGEILLVMIGILLALQVNNWNEEKKERKYEIEVLTEIYEGLRADSARLDAWWLPRIESKLNGIQRISHYVYEGNRREDSTLYDAYNDMGQGFLLSLNMGPYESLKIKGLELISDKSLRFWLVDVFESVLSRQLEASSKGEQDHMKLTDDIYNHLWVENITRRFDGTYGLLRQARYPDILNNELLIQIISAETDVARHMALRIGTIRQTIHATMKKLKDYLVKNDVDLSKSTIGSITGVRGLLSDSLEVTRMTDRN